MSKKAVVLSTNISKKKGTVKESVPKIVLNADGIVGDAHAGSWHRQVSLLAIESIQKFGEKSGQVFEHGDFAENITTEGIDLLSLKLFDQLVIGSTKMEMTQIGKSCHGDGCAIYRKVGKCVMPKEGIFCRIVEGGEIVPSDKIKIVPKVFKARVITLSDRASKGVYKDKSGDNVAQHLEKFFVAQEWRFEIERILLPDDAAQIEVALLAAKEDKIDVVFTTGGTGIGSRDVTPEAVLGVCDKVIPGIMEHIRLKFGVDKPNALISRSIAATLGKTLVFSLPGSVRATQEYMGEILKLLEHLVLMIHDIDAHMK
ncbi:MAG: molybdenum cofactor synthesis domain-containing protein [Alphaproteobacteria bacterium]